MSTMSSSPRKHRTTGSSSAGPFARAERASRVRRAAKAGLVAGLLVAAIGCRRSGEDVLVTYFSEKGFSLRHPASWRIGEAKQNGTVYQYLVPPTAAAKQPPLAVTLLAGAASVPVDEYAHPYLAQNNLVSSQPEEREGTSGRSWVFTTADGKQQGRLLLLSLQGRIVGLHALGESPVSGGLTTALDEIWSSFTIERPERYPVHTWPAFGASLGVPRTWKQTQQFSGRGTMLVQFASPPLAVEKRQTIHAALSLTLGPAPQGGLDDYYETTRRKLGENYLVASHEPLNGGIVDLMRTETPLAVSYIRRYYFVEGGTACSLSFEAREDVFTNAARWADAIAPTLRLGSGALASGANR